MKIKLCILGLLLSFQLSATWQPFGPENISANKVCFNLGLVNAWGVCHDEGIAIYNHLTQSWTDFESNLPVISANYLDGTKILLIMGGGSNSDGIYTLDPSEGTFELVSWVDYPNFLFFDEQTQEYFIGHHLGLLHSADGINWTPVEAFNNKNMVAMDSYQEHYVVSEMDNQFGIWYSSDSGSSWEQSVSGSPMISCFGFNSHGKLYGVFPDESWSSGLWSSEDFGKTWEVEFWSVNINCVGFDAMGNVFVGWGENSTGMEEGIAHYDPESGEYHFMNEGLSSLVINEIAINPYMSAIALFCCTEKGAFVTYGPTQSTEVEASFELNIFPNPGDQLIKISYRIPDASTNTQLYIYNSLGQAVKQYDLDPRRAYIELDASGYSSGIYFIYLKGVNFAASQKMLILGS